MSATLTKLPNLTRAFAMSKLLLDIRKILDKDTGLGISLINAIDNNKFTAAQTISMIKDCIEDNRPTMLLVLGEELLERVDNIIIT